MKRRVLLTDDEAEIRSVVFLRSWPRGDAAFPLPESQGTHLLYSRLRYRFRNSIFMGLP
jgi:hypothetical protein